MSSAVAKAEQNRFELHGSVAVLRKAATPGYAPQRQLGGWLATSHKIAADGSLVPTVDREGHFFEAAKTLGAIDFSEYLDPGKGARGLWNDTHHFNGQAWVGVPTALEHHDEVSDLAKAHGKVGWWTEGHLFDRNDPKSWTEFTTYVPTPTDLDRADYYWNAAVMLKGLPRDLGFSAHGKMLLSPCGRRIIWAAVTECAVCELPQNPDATVQPLRLAVPIEPGMLGRDDCATCACPPNLRCPPLRKAVTTATVADIVPQDLEGATPPGDGDQDPRERRLIERVVQQLVARGVDEARARRWVQSFAAARRQQQQQGQRPASRSTHG